MDLSPTSELWYFLISKGSSERRHLNLDRHSIGFISKGVTSNHNKPRFLFRGLQNFLCALISTYEICRNFLLAKAFINHYVFLGIATGNQVGVGKKFKQLKITETNASYISSGCGWFLLLLLCRC
jgi:hypothetical protein